MKTNKLSRKQFSQTARNTAFLVGVIMACGSTANAEPSQTGAGSQASDSPDLVNWVEFGIGGNFVHGDKAQFQRQSGLPASAFGGITGFHYEEPYGKKGIFSLDGRVIFDNHDYDLKMELANPDVGYVRAGFNQFREYYDGHGGYLPPNRLSFNPQNLELSLDRGTAFFETGLTLPDYPSIKFRYQHDFRKGAKDSTEWGATTLAPGGATKLFTPGFRLLDEKTDSFSVDLSHTLHSTDVGLGFRYQWVHDNDSRGFLQYPTQTTGANQSRTLTQTDFTKSDIFNVHGYTDTRLGEQWELTSGYAYTHLHAADLGSRLDNPGAVTSSQLDRSRYPNLSAASAIEQYEMSLSAMYSPSENWNIVPSARIEKATSESTSGYNAITSGTVGTLGVRTVNSDSESQINGAEALDIRYVGITNWVFYVRTEWEENRDSLGQSSGAITNNAFNLLIYNGAWHQVSQKYAAGANWYPQRGLNFATQYYHKIDVNNFENNTPYGGLGDPVPPNQYPGFMRKEIFITDDANFRVTWKATKDLSLVSRYDFKYSTVDMQGGNPNQTATIAGTPLQLVPVANTTQHIFSETVSWTPINRFFTQFGANYTLNSTHTGAETWPSTLGVILKSQNDYWTLNTLMGYAINDKTDIRASYTYTRSADYSDNSSLGLPLGAGGEDHSASATLGRQIRKNLHGSLKYTYMNYRDQLFGSNLNFQSHGILATFQYRF